MSGPVRVVCRPLTGWPGRLQSDSARVRSRFRSGWSDTMDLLTREARMIGSRDLVIQLAVPDSEIRLDGWPYARAKARHPGVTVVVPDSRHGRLSWSTDRYDRWQDNVHAVARSMEALRAADRHGIMQGRQYAGFRELAAGSNGDAPMTVEDAARFIAKHAVIMGDSPDDLLRPWGPQGKGWVPLLHDLTERSRAYRIAARSLHPDAGGDPDLFRRLEAARRLLEAPR